MGNFFLRGNPASTDNKRVILGTLDSIKNYLVMEGSESERFALSVAREVVATSSAARIQEAIQAVMEKNANKHA
jgi:hypothetical protein